MGKNIKISAQSNISNLLYCGVALLQKTMFPGTCIQALVSRDEANFSSSNHI